MICAAGPSPSTHSQAHWKVAFVVSSRIWGGGEAQVAYLAQGLREQGHTCQFFSRQAGPFAERMRRAGFPLWTFRGSGRDPITIWRIRRWLANWRPDVLHLNDPHAVTCGGLAARGLSIPARIAARRSVFPIRCARRYTYLANRIICVAEAVAASCRQAGIPHDRLRVVHDGAQLGQPPVGSRQQVRCELGIAPDAPLLLTIALLHPLKGHCYLIEALPRVLADHPNAVALLAGSGAEELRLRRLADRLGVTKQVRFVGFRRDVARLIRAADLFVMPSLSEGLCSSLIDAMLGGLPVVTTTAGGIAELVAPQPGESAPVAWTVPSGCPEALAAAVLDAIGRPGERSVRAARARRRAESHFSLARMVDATLGVYRELLEPA